jgi:hypothetical protein
MKGFTVVLLAIDQVFLRGALCCDPGL